MNKYSDDRISLANEIAETLESNGCWVPRNHTGPDLIMAVGKALAKKEATIATLTAENERLRESADRWDALMSCERIRVLGFARQGGGGRIEDTGPIKHIGIEFWDTFPDDTGESSERLIEFVAGIQSKAQKEREDG